MKKAVLLVPLVLLQIGTFSQSADSLSLEECIRLAGTRSPINRQKNLAAEALEFKLKNLGVHWFPSVGLNAQASYNSETVDFADIITGLPVSIPSLPLDQYKVWADINQQLYDGGSIKARKALEKTSFETQVHQVETELTAVKQQVMQAYFSLLLTKKGIEILQVSLNELLDKKRVVLAGVENGVVLAENMLSLEAEELKIQQRLSELSIASQQLFIVLSILTDSTLEGNIALVQPSAPVSFDEQITRSEYLLFEKQKEGFTAGQGLVVSTAMPKLFAFSQAAYGRPGYNFASRNFHAFYSVGVGMKWNFLNYGDNRRQIKILDLQKEMVDVKLDAFNDQLAIQLEAERSNLAKYSEFLSRDEQILKLRKSITAASFAKLSNGIITSSDYLTELNAEILANLQYENHKIQKTQAAYNYLLLLGKL